MVLENFKSYAGVKEIGPFHKSFTSIVGPNGSGKSNVIDGKYDHCLYDTYLTYFTIAIQFVFGKRSTKLRLKKLSELIHNSDNHQGLRFAKVSVHFCEIIDRPDEDGYDVAPNSELIVSRSVDQKSSSKYYIGSTVSSFKEVTELLKHKGIDLDNNRFLILQGEVELISLMKPIGADKNETGLLEYIEDIIGTNQYIDQIKKAEELVEELNEKRTEKLNRLKSVENEKDGLEGSKNEAVEYLAKKRELIKNHHISNQIKKHKAETELKSLEEKKAELKQKYDSEKENLKSMHDKSSKIEHEYKEIKQNHDQVADGLKEAKDQWTSFQRKDIKLKGDRKHAKAKKIKLEESIKEAEAKIETFQKKISKAEKGEAKHSEALKTLTEELERAEKSEDQMYRELQSEIEPIRVEKEKKQKGILPINKQMNEIKQKIDVAASEIELLNEKSQSSQKQYDEAVETLEQRKEELEAALVNVTKHKKHHQQVEKRIPETKNQLQKLTEEEAQLEIVYQKARSNFQTLSAEMTSAKTQNKLMESLMKHKEEGTIAGIHDRLGSLGTIDKKYDVAVTTACGALNHIVVDTTDAGMKCVELLRRENLGVATFLMLDKMDPELQRRANSQIETPEKIPRLFDLIKFKNDKFKVAFYFALRDTLVAKDLDQASRIAYHSKDNKNWRVVTLKGELIEQTGTMTGGGNRALSGGMSASFQSQTSAKDVAVAQKSKDEALNNLREVQETKKNVSAQLKTLESQYSNLQMTITKAEMEVKALEAQIQDLTKTVAELKPQINDSVNPEDQDRIEELGSTIKDYKKSMSATEKKYRTMEQEIKDLQHKIDNAGEGKLQRQKERVQLLSDNTNEARQKITKLQVQRESAQKNLKKIETQIEKDKKELEETAEQYTKLSTELKELEVQAQAVFEQVTNAEQLMTQRDTELSDKEAQYDQVKKDVEKSKTLSVEFKNSLDDVEKQIKIYTALVNKHDAQLKKLQEQIKEYLYDEEGDEEENAPEQQQPPAENQQQPPESTTTQQTDQDGDVEMTESQSTQLGKRKRSDDAESGEPAAKRKKTEEIEMLDAEDLEHIEENKLNYRTTLLEAELEKMKPNLSAIDEYRQKEREYNAKFKDLEQTTQDRDRTIKERDNLKKRRLNEFMDGFKIITSKLKEIYQMITLGGDAELELVDTLDPFVEGIEFSVRPPKKSWKKISNLSGGEKTLSSLALVFALHHYKPTPIYVMDEIDAALDFKNVSIVATYIKERTKNAQFLVISLRNNMFELADILVGIYKTHNATKSVTIDPNKIAQMASNNVNRNRNSISSSDQQGGEQQQDLGE
jgi:structural maintenance of chromosome 4